MTTQTASKPDLTEQVAKLKAQLVTAQAEIAKLKAKEASKPKVGDTVEVRGLTSWDGWQGELVAIDEEAGKASIKIWRSKAKVHETHRTQLHRVHRITKPEKK